MKKISVIFLIMLSIPLFSETVIIDEFKAVSLGLENSLSLQQQKITELNAKIDKKTSYNAFYPDIKLNTGVNHKNTGPTMTIYPGGIPTTIDIPPTNFSIGFESSLYLTPAILDGIKLLNGNAELESIKTEKKESEIIRDIKKSFYTLLLLEEQITLFEYNYDSLEKRFNQMQQNYNNGYIDELQLLEVQVALENFRPQLNNLYQLYDLSVKNFKNSLGIDFQTEIILTGSIEIGDDIYGQELLETGVINNSKDLAILEQSLTLLNNQVTLKKHTAFFPVVGLSFSMSTALNDPFNSDTWEMDNFVDDMGSFTLFVSAGLDPFFPNSKERMEIQKLENSKKSTLLGKKELLEGLELGLTQKLQVLNNSLELQESLKSTVKLAQKRVDLTQISYNLGNKELLEIESAENELRKAQLELLSEKYNYLAASFDIEYMIGKAWSDKSPARLSNQGE